MKKIIIISTLILAAAGPALAGGTGATSTQTSNTVAGDGSVRPGDGSVRGIIAINVGVTR